MLPIFQKFDCGSDVVVKVNKAIDKKVAYSVTRKIHESFPAMLIIENYLNDILDELANPYAAHKQGNGTV